MSLARRMFVFAVTGTSFVLLDSFNGFAPLAITGASAGSFLLVYPYTLIFPSYVAAFVLSLLSTVFLAKSKSEFP